MVLYLLSGLGLQKESPRIFGCDIVWELGVPNCNSVPSNKDDYRNPGCIADNVGDNVGDIAGIGHEKDRKAPDYSST